MFVYTNSLVMKSAQQTCWEWKSVRLALLPGPGSAEKVLELSVRNCDQGLLSFNVCPLVPQKPFSNMIQIILIVFRVKRSSRKWFGLSSECTHPPQLGSGWARSHSRLELYTFVGTDRRREAWRLWFARAGGGRCITCSCTLWRISGMNISEIWELIRAI